MMATTAARTTSAARHPLEGGPPLPGQPGGEHDGQGLDRFDRAGDEDGEDQWQFSSRGLQDGYRRASDGGAPLCDNGRVANDDQDAGGGWLLLIYRVPSEPSRLRSAVWRRIKSLGAIYLQNSAAALPVGTGA